MTVQEAKAIIKKTKSPMLRRDLLKFIKRQERKCLKAQIDGYLGGSEAEKVEF